MKILAINPGSTSTKIAVYEDEKPLLESIIRHGVEQLSGYKRIIDQFDYRKSVVIDELRKNNIPLRFDAIIGRGGLIKPIPSGVYEVNDALKNDLIHSNREHASNLGGLIALQLSSEIPGCKTFIADPIVVDELEDVARISGSPLLPRISIFHALNHKAIARRYAKEWGYKYEDINLVICHLGGGITVAAHKKGKVVDVNNGLDGEGPFAPERAGTLPAGQLVNLCFSGEYSKDELLKMLTGNAGIAAHLGTTDMIAILKNIENGDKKAELVINAMIYNVAKAIGASAVVLHGKVDAILITGGMAHSKYIVSRLKEYVSFLAPTKIYPGEDEMAALAINALGALTGELPINNYE
jgi:butyrate kinase